MTKLEESRMVMGTPLHSIRSVTSDLPASPVSLSTALLSGGEKVQFLKSYIINVYYLTFFQLFNGAATFRKPTLCKFGTRQIGVACFFVLCVCIECYCAECHGAFYF